MRPEAARGAPVPVGEGQEGQGARVSQVPEEQPGRTGPLWVLCCCWPQCPSALLPWVGEASARVEVRAQSSSLLALVCVHMCASGTAGPTGLVFLLGARLSCSLSHDAVWVLALGDLGPLLLGLSGPKLLRAAEDVGWDGWRFPLSCPGPDPTLGSPTHTSARVDGCPGLGVPPPAPRAEQAPCGAAEAGGWQARERAGPGPVPDPGCVSSA